MARRKSENRIGLRIGIVIGIVVIIGVAAFVFFKMFFRIKHVNITGTDKYSYEQIYDYIFADRNSENLILFKRSNDKAPKIDIPFISKVDIKIKWPDTINVTVYEKNIIGYVTYKGTNMYFDKDGVVTESSVEVFDEFPHIEGLKYNRVVMYEKLDVSNGDVFKDIHDVTEYINKYNITVDSLVIIDNNEFDVVMGDVTVKLGNNDKNMPDKVYELSCMSSQLEGRNGTLFLQDYNSTTKNYIFKDNDAEVEEE